jgi:cyclopropane fatty-acyl-phospholipid synthase-like methyltransferase
LWGVNIIDLAREGYNDLTGIEFLESAVNIGRKISENECLNIDFICDKYPYFKMERMYDRILAIDVLEHIEDVGTFLRSMKRDMYGDEARALIIVPKGKNWYDTAHINFYPDMECLYNMVSLYFNILDSGELDKGRKLYTVVKI